ncbi:hypothetical protein DXG01_015906 [Tephrocybe rancida]|nr:hypothetical protein DXG01_015906 [Tephrocybe rancida]
MAPPPSSSTTAPPISHQPPPPKQPPPIPPVPTPPAALLKKPTPHRNAEQSLIIWEERIKALAEATDSRFQLTNVETDITQTRLLINTSHYPSLPAEGKARIDDELAQLERKRDNLKKQRDDIVTKLIKADSWPAIPLSDAEDGELGKYNEMVANVTQLKEQVDSINTMLMQLRGDDDAMDVDPHEGPSSRPLKRRRGAEGDVPPEPERGPSAEELEAMSDKVAELETRFAAFANELTVQNANTYDDVEAQIETHLEEFAADLERRAPLGEQVYAGVKGNLDQTGAEVEELAVAIAELMDQANQQKIEMAAARARIATSKEQYAEMQQRFESLQSDREKDRKTIAALEQAVQTYIDTPAGPPAPGPTHDQLVELLEEPLVDLVRATIRPVMEQLRQQVQEMLTVQNAAMYKALWGKLSMTLRMVESISKRLERVDQGPVPTMAPPPLPLPLPLPQVAAAVMPAPLPIASTSASAPVVGWGRQ